MLKKVSLLFHLHPHTYTAKDRISLTIVTQNCVKYETHMTCAQPWPLASLLLPWIITISPHSFIFYCFCFLSFRPWLQKVSPTLSPSHSLSLYALILCPLLLTISHRKSNSSWVNWSDEGMRFQHSKNNRSTSCSSATGPPVFRRKFPSIWMTKRLTLILTRSSLIYPKQHTSEAEQRVHKLVYKKNCTIFLSAKTCLILSFYYYTVAKKSSKNFPANTNVCIVYNPIFLNWNYKMLYDKIK